MGLRELSSVQGMYVEMPAVTTAGMFFRERQWKMRLNGRNAAATQFLWGQLPCRLSDASNHFCYACTGPVLPSSRAAYPAYRRPDTLAHRLRHRCRGTSVRDKMDRHSYVCANLNFRMDVFRLSQPQTFLPDV